MGESNRILTEPAQSHVASKNTRATDGPAQSRTQSQRLYSPDRNPFLPIVKRLVYPNLDSHSFRQQI
jgi:hypothetical protein